jgi:hypothetical protein
MAKPKNSRVSAIPLALHQQAVTEMRASLDAATRADVALVFQQLDGKDIMTIRALLDTRTERKVVQFERSHPAGTLRIVFAWGKACLWFVGAFVKANNAEGERYMRRILPRVDAVKGLGVPK